MYDSNQLGGNVVMGKDLITIPHCNYSRSRMPSIAVFGTYIPVPLNYLVGHSQRTAELSYNLALRLLDADENLAKEGGRLHDIGKWLISRLILEKKGKLNPEEWEEIKTHTIKGMSLLSQAGRLSKVGRNYSQFDVLIDIVGYHHEAYDGSGYWGLKGKDLPLEVWIVNVADSIDTMLSERDYKPAKSIDYVLNELEINQGSQFHPKVVEKALLLLGQRKFLNNYAIY